MKKNNLYFKSTIIAIFFLGSIFRFIGINDILSHDEWYSVDLVFRNFIDMNIQMFSDVHVPLYFFLVNLIVKIFSIENIYLIRIPSVILGILGIIATYKISYKFFNERVSVISTFLISFSAFHIWASQTARMYSLLYLLTTISLYYLFEILLKPQKRSYVYYAILNTLILYTHFFGYFWIISQILIILSTRKKIMENRYLKETIISGVITFITSLPVFIFTFIEFYRKITGTSYSNWMPNTSIDNLIELSRALSSSDLLTIPFLIFILYFLFKNIRHLTKIDLDKEKILNKSLLIILFICLFLPILITFIKPVFAWRYFFVCYISFILIISIILDKIISKNIYFKIIAITTIFGIFGLSSINYINFKDESTIRKNWCQNKISERIEKYKNQNTKFISSRWLNEWVSNHKPINIATKKIGNIFDIETESVNYYHTNIFPYFDRYDFVINVTPPSGWNDYFINQHSKIKKIEEYYCMGFAYSIYTTNDKK